MGRRGDAKVCYNTHMAWDMPQIRA